MYGIDIKDALYFMMICVAVLDKLGKMACFIDSKQPIKVPGSLLFYMINCCVERVK